MVEYSREFEARVAEELGLLPDGSAIAEMLADYSVMRALLHKSPEGIHVVTPA